MTDKLKKKPRVDKLKALIFERKHALNLTYADLALIAGCSEGTISMKFRRPSQEWMSLALVLCRGLGVPIESVREAIEY